MSLDSSFIGKSSTPHVFQVTQEAVQRFIEATEDPVRLSDQPLTYAPPTFPTTFRVRIPTLELDSAKMQLVHGEQEYEYARRLRIGEEVTCVARIIDVRQRTGHSGPMTILVTETTGTDNEQQQVFVGRSTLIVRTKP